MNPHSFTPQRKAQLPRQCGMGCVEMGRVGNQRGHISSYRCNDWFLPDHLFLFKIVNAVDLGPTPGLRRAPLQFLWSVGMQPFPAQPIFVCVEPGERSACPVAVHAPQEIQPPAYLLG